LQEQGELEAAMECYRQALELDAGMAEAHNNLGNALKAQHRDEAALASYRRAIELKPDYAQAYFNLGNVYREGGNTMLAIEYYQQAISIKPGFAEAYNGLGNAQQDLGWFDVGRASFATSLALKADFNVARSNLLFNLNYDMRVSSVDYFAEACRFGDHVAAQARPYTSWPVDQIARAGQPLRIGWVSGDLRMHPVGYFLESVLAHLASDQVELVAFVTKAHEDALTARIKPHFKEWHTLIGLDDAAAARQVHEAAVHILLDLAGHSADNRLPVFAWKPAPLQAAWLGYFASTGVAAIDYIIADPHVLPAAEERYFVEKPWRLPDCYLCFTPPQYEIAVGRLPMLEHPCITFACFNKLNKINAAVAALWSRVLHAVPDSRLLLKAKELNDVALQRSTIERFVVHGVAAQRILVERPTTREDYLTCYNRVDIALDPFPYPGGTTTVEALWMGVPVLSRCGDRFLSHAGESLLATVGLDEWVARDDDDYVLKASAFAMDSVRLAALRAALRARLLASPLCDAPRFANHLNAVFKGMWQERMLVMQEHGI
jgi:protein O-GlcNAc transferase